MKCLAEYLLFTTVRIDVKLKEGFAVGTGFLYLEKDSLFLVTNKHVIEDIIKGRFVLFEAKNNKWEAELGEGFDISFEEKEFYGHPDPKVDVAVMNISPHINAMKEAGKLPYWMHLSSDLIPKKEDLENFISPVDEVMFVGYPNGIWDSENLLPIVRKGITASPYYVDFRKEKKFLIDASVFPGSSGSPVFIYHKNTYYDRSGKEYKGDKLYFLGLISSTYLRNEGEKENLAQMIDLGIVCKADTVKETIDYYLKKAYMR